MEFDMNMVTKDGKKMMYLIAMDVKQDCEYSDLIWGELRRRMNAVSIPIIDVDWTLYDDNGKGYDFSGNLFYAQTFETGMGFLLGVMEDYTLRTHLDFCKFFNGDSYKEDAKRYYAEDVLEAAEKRAAKYNQD